MGRAGLGQRPRAKEAGAGTHLDYSLTHLEASKHTHPKSPLLTMPVSPGDALAAPSLPDGLGEATKSAALTTRQRRPLSLSFGRGGVGGSQVVVRQPRIYKRLIHWLSSSPKGVEWC